MINHDEFNAICRFYDKAYSRTEYCFSATVNKYYNLNGETYFNPFHSGQWCIFLYYLGNTIYNSIGYSTACDKIYYLNRMLNGIDLFHEVKLPDIFILDHPLGTVIGRGTFGNYFCFAQGCTIGNNKGIFPVLGEHVTMLSNAKIIGNSHIGDNVTIAANTYIKDCDIESNNIVFGQSPNLIIKPVKNA
jgi:serine O-acetyltransferase